MRGGPQIDAVGSFLDDVGGRRVPVSVSMWKFFAPLKGLLMSTRGGPWKWYESQVGIVSPIFVRSMLLPIAE